MKPIFTAIILVSLCFFSCQNPSKLEQLLACESSETFRFDKTSTDFNKTFSIQNYKKWKTNLYYDEYQSSIMIADTTKALDKTFIFEIAMYDGELNFTAAFNAGLKAKIEQNNLELVEENYFKWQDKPAYYSRSKGIKNKRNYQELNIYINHEPTRYLKAQIQVYGDQNIQERFCSSLQLFTTLKIK
ncbi:MAG: hypothetical protein JKY08_04935 [Flavobacteriaceae bacterium]|nr:hypothetical protein [Flavobacteriaceae bacterium]